MKKEISFEEFQSVDIRIGTIIEVKDFPKARNAAYQLIIDFGFHWYQKIKCSNYRSLHKGRITPKTSECNS